MIATIALLLSHAFKLTFPARSAELSLRKYCTNNDTDSNDFYTVPVQAINKLILY